MGENGDIMDKVKIICEKNFKIGDVDERLFSSFIEHLGRAVYTGIYEKDHPTADEQGFRKDVIDLVKELQVPLVRYPGGNFLSGYNWTDGIGPVANRPKRLELAWRSIEPNTIGIDEFVDWSKKAGTGIMGAVNMGTGTPQEAANFVEYCNFPGGTYWSDLRKSNGHESPHNIKTWCIGNEMDGPWQICHMEADDYGKKALETAKLMKLVDKDIELVVCGSSSSKMPTFPAWDRTVLEHTYDKVDFISLHRYYEDTGNIDDFLASFVDMNDFIKSVCATADYVKTLKRSKKTMMLSFDEWNVWYQRKTAVSNWEFAPRILEDRYSLLDALVVGGLGITLLNNCDRVKMACLAQLVNVIAPIFTEPGGKAIKQTIFYPFKDISVYGRGTVLHSNVVCKTKETRYGDAPIVASAVVLNPEETELTVFALNTNTVNAENLELNLHSFEKAKMISHSVLSGKDLNAINTFENPDLVTPHYVEVSNSTDNVFDIHLEKGSWNTIRFSFCEKE